MEASVSARLPELRSGATGIAIEWVKRTAEATVKAQGPEFRVGLELTGTALEAALTTAGVRLNRDSVMALVDAAWRRYLERPKLYDDVSKDFLIGLRSIVRTLGIITDSDNSMVMPLISRLGLRELFDVIVVSESVGAYKPNPRIYHAALDASAADATSSTFVSDSLTDLKGASAVGMGTIWIRRRGPLAGEYPPEGSLVITDMRQLPEILKSKTPL